MALLKRAGLPPNQTLEFINAATTFLIGHAFAQVGSLLDVSAEVSNEQIIAYITEAINIHDYPHFTEAFESGIQASDLRIYEAGLRTLLLGLEARLKNSMPQTHPGPTPPDSLSSS